MEEYYIVVDSKNHVLYTSWYLSHVLQYIKDRPGQGLTWCKRYSNGDYIL